MKRKSCLVVLLSLTAAELGVFFWFVSRPLSVNQDMILVNEVLHSLQEDWDRLEIHKQISGLEYTVLDEKETVRIQTKPGISESIYQAVLHRDTILPVQKDGHVVGTLILFNGTAERLQAQKRVAVALLVLLFLLQTGIGGGYFFWINQRIFQPFHRLKGFAERIAGGNLEVPLEMDRQNVFGAFTESFDLMRTELKKARQAEWEANQSKKELIAKLSHDIKTPVASIKAASEVGEALATEKRQKETYLQIIQKADQINTLVSNLFTAALEDLEQLSVKPEDISSEVLKELLENADYLHHATIPAVPSCMIYADRLRLQQVFDNLFVNSYKYADTQIEVSLYQKKQYLAVVIEDLGGGVRPEELPLLKQKYLRGKNAEGLEGAGLGLFISDYFMKEMQGELFLQNGEQGLQVTVNILLSGTLARR